MIDGKITDPFVRNWLDLLCFLLSGLPANGTIAAEVSVLGPPACIACQAWAQVSMPGHAVLVNHDCFVLDSAMQDELPADLA